MTVVSLLPTTEELLKGANIDRENWAYVVNTAVRKYLKHEYNTEIIEKTKEKKGYACELCNRRFKSKLALNTHYTKAHVIKKEPQICEICGKTYSCIRTLRAHMCNVHDKCREEEKRELMVYFCSKCKKLHKIKTRKGREHLEFKTKDSDEIVHKINSEKNAQRACVKNKKGAGKKKEKPAP